MRCGRPYHPPIGFRAIPTCDLRWILSTQSRSTLKMRGFEPSIHLDFENGFFEKVFQLRSFFLRAFLSSSRWPRGTVNMESIELVAIWVGPSGLQNFFLGPCRAPRGPPGRGKKLRARSFVAALGRQTERPHIYNGLCGPEASYTVKMRSIWPSLGAL